jgi:SAM-dependent methyltransferase
MGQSGIDAGEFRAGQRDQWNVAASGWKKWSELLDRAWIPVSERLVELAGVQPGSRVLDVAAGYGEPALTAARAAGAEGSVVATDISAEMLAFGRERAANAGLGNIDFVKSDASSLEFPEHSFDAAVSRWGIIFEPDGESAAAKVRGFLKSGAQMAISSWGPPERTPFLGIPVRTVIDRLGVEPPPAGTPGPLSRPTPEAIAGLLEGGGFSEVQAEEMDVTLEFASAEEFTICMREIAPPITGMMAGHPEDAQRETWDAITEAVRDYAGDGEVRLTNLVLLAAGRA